MNDPTPLTEAERNALALDYWHAHAGSPAIRVDCGAAAAVLRSLGARVERAEATLARVRSEATNWANAPEGEVAPCRGVGHIFLAILDASAVSEAPAPTEDARAQRVIDEHMRKISHRVMDVFETADEDTLADEIMTDVFAAIGLVEAFTGNRIESEVSDV